MDREVPRVPLRVAPRLPPRLEFPLAAKLLFVSNSIKSSPLCPCKRARWRVKVPPVLTVADNGEVGPLLILIFYYY